MEDTQAGLLDVRTEGHGKTPKERVSSLSARHFASSILSLTVKEQPSLGSQEGLCLL